MAELIVQELTEHGLVPSTDLPDVNGDSFVNDGKTIIGIYNGSGSSLVVTILSQVLLPPPGTFRYDLNVVVGTGHRKYIGPIHKAYNDKDDLTHLTYAGTVTGTTIFVAKLVY